MRTFDMTLGGHEFEKQNIVTIGKKRGYDVYKCKKCGITGKSYRFGMIDIKDADVKKMQKCNSLKKGKSLYKLRLLTVKHLVINLKILSRVVYTILYLLHLESHQNVENG